MLYLSQLSSFLEKIKNILPISLVFLVFLSQTVNSQEIFQNSIEIEKFNSFIETFNNTKQYYNDIRKKVENLTLNVILKIRLRQLSRLYIEIERQYVYITRELTKEKYDNKQITNDIDLINKNMKNFKKEYNSLNESYYKFEEIKEYLSSFIKLFLLVLFIIIVVVFVLIAIGSFFVIKSQKKYYILREEISLSKAQKISEKNEGIDLNEKNNNSKNDNRFDPKGSTGDLQSDLNGNKRVIIKPTENSSKEPFSKKKKI